MFPILKNGLFSEVKPQQAKTSPYGLIGITENSDLQRSNLFGDNIFL